MPLCPKDLFRERARIGKQHFVQRVPEVPEVPKVPEGLFPRYGSTTGKGSQRERGQLLEEIKKDPVRATPFMDRPPVFKLL